MKLLAFRRKERKMEYYFKPQGVCSKEMIIEVEGDIIKKVKIIGGCAGNSFGISKLVEGMRLEDVIKRLKGINCGIKNTSCPDQLATALEEIKEKRMQK
jgi:uncharacterized protein TIGR03905